MSALIQLEPGGQTRGLNDKDAEIEELKEKNYALQSDYRNKARELLNCSRSLLDKDDQIDQLNRQIDNLQTLCGTIEKLQTENANLKSSVKEKDILIVELQKCQSVRSDIKSQPENNNSLNSENESAESKLQMKQQIDSLNKLVQSLQSEIGNLHKKLQIQSDKCKELEEYIDENAVDLPPGGIVHEGKIIITGQVDEEMPEAELTKDIQTETDLIFLSSDEEESCEPAKIKAKYEFPDSTQRPIREEEFKESTSEPMLKSHSFRINDQGIEEEEKSKPEGEIQRSVQDECRRRFRPYSDEEVNQIVYYIFNVYKPVKPNPPFGVAYFKKLSKKLAEDNVCERTFDGLNSYFRRKRMYDLYKNKQLHTAEHREIAVRAFLAYDRKQVHKLIEQYDQARWPGITDEEVAQIKSLKKHVRVENNNLEDCLDKSGTELVESENKCKEIEKLIEENTVEIIMTEQVDEEMPQAESTKDIQTETDLISLSSEEPEAQRSVQNKNPIEHLPKPLFSEEEINQIVHYIFNVYKPLKPNPTFSVLYFRILSKKLEEDSICVRSSDCLIGTFRYRRVYELYKNKQLHTAEHREIAVKAFEYFDCKGAPKLIDQYDRARASGITDEAVGAVYSTLRFS